MASELLILSLDLVKNRVGVMSLEMRKSFIGQILVGLIEKTSDSKVMKAITKMVEDWVKTKVIMGINDPRSIDFIYTPCNTYILQTSFYLQCVGLKYM